MATDEVRATLHGDHAVLGRISARDVARVINGLESVLAAAAYATLGQPRRASTGRHRAAVEAAARLVFTGVERGSIDTVMALPEMVGDDENALDVATESLAQGALNMLLRALDGPDDHMDDGIARALADLANDLGIGERHRELVVSSRQHGATLRLDARARTRVRRFLDRPDPQQPDVLVGTLQEADFTRRTARLHTSSGETVVVRFPDTMDDEIQEGLRQPAEFAGAVTFDRLNATARRVDLVRMSKELPLPFDADAFWSSVPVAALIEAQSIVPAALEGPMMVLSDREKADLVEALDELDG